MTLLLALLACDTGPNYGPFTTIVRAHRTTLETMPCDARVRVELGSALRDALAYEEALQSYRDYAAACEPKEASVLGPWLELSRTKGPADEPLTVAKLMHETDPDNRVWRQSYVDELLVQGQTSEAIPMLRQAWLASSKDFASLAKLAQAQEDGGAACDALVNWGVLWWKSPDMRGKAGTAVARLEAQCPGVTLKEEGTVKQNPDNGYWRFDVGFGDTKALLALDTAAGLTYISPELLERIEGAEKVAEGVTMKAGTGTLEGDIYKVSEMRVGTVTVKNIELLVVPRISRGMEGFIGLNVGSRMRMSEETERLWTIEPAG